MRIGNEVKKQEQLFYGDQGMSLTTEMDHNRESDISHVLSLRLPTSAHNKTNVFYLKKL